MGPAYALDMARQYGAIRQGRSSVVPTQLDITFDRVPGCGTPANIQNQINTYVLAYSGKRVRVRVGPPERSSAANRYYWGFVLAPIVQALHAVGYERINAEMLHGHYKQMYLQPQINAMPTGPSIMVYSTRDLDSAQFTRYIEQIRTSEIVLRLGVRIETVEEYQDRTQQRFKSWGIE